MDFIVNEQQQAELNATSLEDVVKGLMTVSKNTALIRDVVNDHSSKIAELLAADVQIATSVKDISNRVTRVEQQLATTTEPDVIDVVVNSWNHAVDGIKSWWNDDEPSDAAKLADAMNNFATALQHKQ